MDPKKIAETRKAERHATADVQARQAVALEQIADTLEALRMAFVSWLSSPARTPRG